MSGVDDEPFLLPFLHARLGDPSSFSPSGQCKAAPKHSSKFFARKCAWGLKYRVFSPLSITCGVRWNAP